MKLRYLYALLFCIPAFLTALILTALLGGVIGGILWLYVFGDNAWPQGIDLFLIIPLIIVFTGIWIILLTLAFNVGKAQETSGNIPSKRAVSLALSATVFLSLMIVFHQWRIGNIGPKTTSAACSDYCKDNGYNTSMMPPRYSSESNDASCNCMEGGKIHITIPLSELRAKG